MLCETNNHLPDCSCQELKTLYGSNLYKCDRPGCLLYRVGFDTAAERNEHVRRHTRPFKCQIPNCPYTEFGFATANQLAAHSTQAHEERPSIATTEWKELSSEEAIRAILIDAVKENDLSTIRERDKEVKKFTLSLLLTAYQERSSEAMIKHLLETFPKSSFRFVDSVQLIPMMSLIDEIFKASVKHGNYDVFRGPNELLTFWKYHTRHRPAPARTGPFHLVGSTRCVDLIEAILSANYLEQPDLVVSSHVEFSPLCLSTIPSEPDAQQELLALECLSRVKSHYLFSTVLHALFISVGKGCCSIAIAEFLLANGANIDWSTTIVSQIPIVFAARKTSKEAARFIEFLVRKGATTPMRVRGKAFRDLPGPKNIQNWIGITWDELVRQSALPDK